MSIQIFGLIIVMLGFATLVTWVFWPGNRERFESHGRLILDAQEDEEAEQGGQS